MEIRLSDQVPFSVVSLLVFEGIGFDVLRTLYALPKLALLPNQSSQICSPVFTLDFV